MVFGPKGDRIRVVTIFGGGILRLAARCCQSHSRRWTPYLTGNRGNETVFVYNFVPSQKVCRVLLVPDDAGSSLYSTPAAPQHARRSGW